MNIAQKIIEAHKLKFGSLPPLQQCSVSGSALFNADCMDILPLIPDKSVQLILADLPYGTTHDRDFLAAVNIKNFALRNYVSGTDTQNRNELHTLVGVMTSEAQPIASGVGG